MRRWIAVFLWTFILLSLAAPIGRAHSGAWSLQVLEADEHHLLLELTLTAFESDTITHAGIQYQRLRVADWSTWGQPGQPQLPMLSVPLGMPWPGTPHVAVIEAESDTYEGYLVYPAPAMELEGTEDASRVVEAFALDPHAYSADAVYPGPLTEATSIGFLRDQPVFQLRLYPFQYNPLQRALHAYRRLKVLVTFPERAPLSLAPIPEAPSLSAPVSGAPYPGSAQSSLVFEHILERTLLNYDTLPRPAPVPINPPVATLATPDSGPQVKLRVAQSGLYRVTYNDLLAAAPGLLQGDPRYLELSNQGSPVPVLFTGEADGRFDPGDSLLFYGQAIRSDYTRYNVYWLTDGTAPGLRMLQRNGMPGAGSTPATFSDRRYYEEDHVYWRGMPNGEGKDHWFWSGLSVSGSTPVSADYAFDLRHIATSGPDGRLRLALQGATFGNHLTQCYLNGVALLSPAARAWSDKVEKLYEIPVPQSLFVEGTNHLRVEDILPAGQSSSEVYVNWFEVTYRDTYVAEDNRLPFSVPSAGTCTFELTGFSTNAIGLFDITDPAAPVYIVNPAIEPAGGGYRLRFSDNAAAISQYLAQRVDQLPAPSLQLDEPSAWRSAAHGATYVVVTHPSFYDALQPLVAHRADHGETVAIVKTEDVYDEFNGGIYDPRAIRSFLEYAYDHWSPRPVYVLLVGDASRDPKNNRGSSLPDLLPTYYVDIPLYGQSPDDAWYAKVHGGDDYPDLIVGRIPARYTSDIAAAVDKVRTYEQAPLPGNWTRRAVLVADDGDSAFTHDMNTIANMLPGSVTPVKMYSYDPNTSVQSEVSTGALLFAYSGHANSTSSSWGEWPGGHLIFDQSQMQSLWNGDRLPFMTVADCLSGRFDHYDRPRGTAEEFVLLANRGGIASWASASEGFPTTNSLIMEALYQDLLVDGDLTLGSAATAARIEAHLRRPDLPLSLLEVFTYFGDPAVRLNIPASLSLGGQDSPDPVVIGRPLTYTLVYTVSGADQARGLTLVNALPQQVTYQSATPAPSSIYEQTLTWNLRNVLVGSRTITVTALVRSVGLAHGQALQDQALLYDATGGDQVLELRTMVHDSPIAGLSASSDAPTELGDVTTVSATTASGTNVVYTWNLGDGTPLRSGTPVQHAYPAIGTYTARVTATNGVSSQSQALTVTITDVPPLASFVSSSPDRLGQTTSFQSTSSGTNLAYRWGFGDGSSSASGQRPTITHTYAHTGTYSVTLTISNSVGSSAASGTVGILPQVSRPVASFTSSSPDECGQTTVFVNASQDGGDDEENVVYAWNFGDGTVSAARHPTHTYTAPGSYPVSLTISNSVASDTFGGTVQITDAPIRGPTIQNDSPTPLGHATAFSASVASGTRISYLWALGDGTLSTRQSLTHTYAAVGRYTVVLTATNSIGSQTVTGTVTIVDESIEGLSISHSDPTILGHSTAFTASLTAGTNIADRWNLGDGSTSSVQNPVHTYAAVGDYAVVLTATNSWGNLVRSDTVSVYDVPISALSVSHSGPTMLGTPTTLTATVATGTNVVYNWDLGDGHMATGAHLTHTYTAPGTYQVAVAATNGANVREASTSVFVFDPDLSLFLPLICKASAP